MVSRGIQGLVGASLLTLVWLDLGPGAPVWKLADRATEHQQLQRLDAVIARAASPGDMQLHFEGFDPADRQAAQSMLRLYFRCCLDAYPRPPRVGSGKAILNTASDIGAADDLPSDDALRAKGIKRVLTFTRVAKTVKPTVREVR